MYKEMILSHILPYIKLKGYRHEKRGKLLMVQCPYCEQDSAQIIANGHLMECHNCNKRFTLVTIVRKIEPDKADKTKWDAEKVTLYLKKLLNANVITPYDKADIEKIFDFLEKKRWSLMPVVKGIKKQPVEEAWTDKTHYDKDDWKDWVFNKGTNIGARTGKVSEMMAIDLDALTKSEKLEIRLNKASQERVQEILKIRKERLKKIKDLLGDIGNPLIQENLGGEHLIYKYDPDIPKSWFNLEGIHVDVQNEGGYILIAPSYMPNSPLNFKELKDIPAMPASLKKLVLDNCKAVKTNGKDEIRKMIDSGNFKINPKDFKLKDNGLEGHCNNSFIALGGMLRKKLNPKNVEYVLSLLDNHLLEEPMGYRAIKAMVRGLEKYDLFDDAELAKKVLDYLSKIKKSGRKELCSSTGESPEKLAKTLAYLIDEGYIKQDEYDKYFVSDKVVWKNDLIDVGKPINFKMPFFHDVHKFKQGDMIIVGGKPAIGKTHICMSMIKQLAQQKIPVYYIPREPGCRHQEIALQLRLDEKAYFYPDKICIDPIKIELEPNAVTIIDWLLPKDYAKTDQVFDKLNAELSKKKGILIVFVQLRKSSGEFYAPDQIEFFPSLVAKYSYDDEEGFNGHFEITKIRERAHKKILRKIPCQFIWETKELKRVDELVNKSEMLAPEAKGEELKDAKEFQPDYSKNPGNDKHITRDMPKKNNNAGKVIGTPLNDQDPMPPEVKKKRGRKKGSKNKKKEKNNGK